MACWRPALISNVLGTKLPGPGTIYLGQDLRFLRPVSIGDTITATLTVTEKHPEKGDLSLDCRCTNQNGEVVISGTAYVRAPNEKVRRPRVELPEVQLSRHERFRACWLRRPGTSRWRRRSPIPATPMRSAPRSKRPSAGLIAPILVGPRRQDPRGAAEAKVDISAFRSDRCAAQRSRGGRGRGAGQEGRGAAADEGLAAYRRAAARGAGAGQRAAYRTAAQPCLSDGRAELSAAAAGDGCGGEYRARLSKQKRDIVQNAIDLAHVMGIESRGWRCSRRSRRSIPSCDRRSMPRRCARWRTAARSPADRGRAAGFRQCGEPAAAAEKGIVSKVAGQADILVVPDLEAGNMLAKQLTFLAGADAAGVVLGAACRSS